MARLCRARGDGNVPFRSTSRRAARCRRPRALASGWPGSPAWCPARRRCPRCGGGSPWPARSPPGSARPGSPWSMPSATRTTRSDPRRTRPRRPRRPRRDSIMAKTSQRIALPGDALAHYTGASAGALGLLIAIAVFAIAIVCFVAESYFLSMLAVSIALLCYVAGGEMIKLVQSSLTVFFSSRHVVENAVHLGNTVAALRKALYMKRDDQ